MCQVDDFAIAAPDQRTADILLDMLDDKLSMPVKELFRLWSRHQTQISQKQQIVYTTAT
jgi:hypothetical protein